MKLQKLTAYTKSQSHALKHVFWKTPALPAERLIHHQFRSIPDGQLRDVSSLRGPVSAGQDPFGHTGSTIYGSIVSSAFATPCPDKRRPRLRSNSEIFFLRLQLENPCKLANLVEKLPKYCACPWQNSGRPSAEFENHLQQQKDPVHNRRLARKIAEKPKLKSAGVSSKNAPRSGHRPRKTHTKKHRTQLCPQLVEAQLVGGGPTSLVGG